jgi:hypothetical protein
MDDPIVIYRGEIAVEITFYGDFVQVVVSRPEAIQDEDSEYQHSESRMFWVTEDGVTTTD